MYFAKPRQHADCAKKQKKIRKCSRNTHKRKKINFGKSHNTKYFPGKYTKAEWDSKHNKENKGSPRKQLSRKGSSNQAGLSMCTTELNLIMKKTQTSLSVSTRQSKGLENFFPGDGLILWRMFPFRSAAIISSLQPLKQMLRQRFF